MTTIAVMQPYFLPYAGYFRLCAASDAFVLHDDVQIPGGGWVHRNRLRNHQGNLSWLTLPLAKHPHTTHINQLRFRQGYQGDMAKQLRCFPLFESPAPHISELTANLVSANGEIVDYLCALLETTCRCLDINVTWIRSSSLGIDPELRGYERVLAITRMLGASTYINAPGGVSLYKPEDFRRNGVRLRFLSPYRGSMESILQHLHDTNPKYVRDEIYNNMAFE